MNFSIYFNSIQGISEIIYSILYSLRRHKRVSTENNIDSPYPINEKKRELN